MLLGRPQPLAERLAQVRGNVKFMFQPAEENGGAGALRMIEAGVLEDPTVDATFAQHVSMARFVGQMGVTPGQAQASSDRFTITIRGRGGHAARRHLAVDPLVRGTCW